MPSQRWFSKKDKDRGRKALGINDPDWRLPSPDERGIASWRNRDTYLPEAFRRRIEEKHSSSNLPRGTIVQEGRSGWRRDERTGKRVEFGIPEVPVEVDRPVENPQEMHREDFRHLVNQRAMQVGVEPVQAADYRPTPWEERLLSGESKGYKPAYNPRTGDIVGYVAASTGVYKVFDRNGHLVGMDEIGLETPIVSPLDIVDPDLLRIGGTLFVKGIGMVAGRSVAKEMATDAAKFAARATAKDTVTATAGTSVKKAGAAGLGDVGAAGAKRAIRIVDGGLGLDPRTAGSGLIDSIVGERLKDGTISVTIQGRVGPKLRQRLGFEKTALPNRAGFDKAHLWGRLFGDEAAAGIMYAPRGLNRSLQLRLENTVGNFAARAAKSGNTVEAQAIAVANPARELQHVQYTVWERTAKGDIVGGFTMTVDRELVASEPRWLDLERFVPPF